MNIAGPAFSKDRKVALVISACVILSILVLVGIFNISSAAQRMERTIVETSTVTSSIPYTSIATETELRLMMSTDYLSRNVTETYESIVTTTSTVTTTLKGIVDASAPGVLGTSNSLDNILVGGQNGTWFTNGQYPTLSIISLDNFASAALRPIPGDAAQQGTVWGGGWNGSAWFVSGWGTNGNDSSPSYLQNPYFHVYATNGTLLSGRDPSINVSQEDEWKGGDIFAASSNGTEWFVSGMGSGILPSYSPLATNHLSVGLINDSYFTDLSSLLSRQMDGILYTNAYGGGEWLVGGGWMYKGVLFSFNGTCFTDLTSEISSAVPTFHSVTSIAWNGQYWLIGGAGFVARYNGSSFTDLTSELNNSLDTEVDKISTTGLNSVNAIVWNGSDWLLGGGLTDGYVGGPSYAWLAAYNSSAFADLTNLLPAYAQHPSSISSVLWIAYVSGKGCWIVGGYSGGHGLLLEVQSNWIVQDLSGMVAGMRYVNWVGSAGR